MERSVSKKFALEDFKVFSSILKTSHPSLNIYISPQRFDLMIDSIRQTIKDDIAVNELFKKYAYIVNAIGCSHSYIQIPNADYDSLLNRKFFFPLPVKWIDGRLIVNATGMEVTQGTEIISINRKPVKEILEDIMIYETVEGLHRSAQKKVAVESFALNYFYAYSKAERFDLLVTDTTGEDQSIDNLSPITFITLLGRLRLELATQLLNDSELSITHFGLAVGYTIASSFTRSFERMTGRSPKNWRAEHGPLRSIALRNPEV